MLSFFSSCRINSVLSFIHYIPKYILLYHFTDYDAYSSWHSSNSIIVWIKMALIVEYIYIKATFTTKSGWKIKIIFLILISNFIASTELSFLSFKQIFKNKLYLYRIWGFSLYRRSEPPPNFFPKTVYMPYNFLT